MINLFYISDIGRVWGALFCLGLAGGWISYSFRNILKYPILTAPLAGLPVMALGIGIFHTMLGFEIFSASIMTFSLSSLLTIVWVVKEKVQFQTLNPYRVLGWILFLIFFVGWVTYYINFSSIQNQEPSLLFQVGSDQVCYSHTSAWMLDNPFVKPVADSRFIYQSWPAAMFDGDARFGAYFIYALGELFFKENGIFVYPILVTVVLLSGYLGIAALYCKSVLSFTLILAGLVLSAWFDLAHTGYLGKLLGYPSILMLIGIFMKLNKFSMTTGTYFILGIITCGTATMYPAQAVIFYLICILGLYLLVSFSFNYLGKSPFDLDRDKFYFFLLILLIALATRGILALPQQIGKLFVPMVDQSANRIAMIKILSFVFDFGFDFTAVSQRDIQRFIYSSIIFLLFLFYAFKQKNKIAVSLMGGLIPVILVFCVFNWMGNSRVKWPLVQMTGFVYPLVLLGMVQLFDGENNNILLKRFWFFLILIVMFIRLREERFDFAKYVHSGKGMNHAYLFKSSELAALADAIGDETVTVDTGDVHYVLPVLVELGRKNINLQWTAASWAPIAGYRGWEVPPLKPSRLWLKVLSDTEEHEHIVKFKTRQYQLIYLSKAK